MVTPTCRITKEIRGKATVNSQGQDDGIQMINCESINMQFVSQKRMQCKAIKWQV